MMKEWDFAPITYERDRTFLLYGKIEDHANDVHDYLKFLKFGYGRATDDASMEIRHGRLSREEGIDLVEYYDSREPRSLDMYCDFLQISKERFYEIVEPMRDPKIWEKMNGKWIKKDSVSNHKMSPLIEKARVKPSGDATFSEKNRNLYYNSNNPPQKRGDPRLDNSHVRFKIM